MRRGTTPTFTFEVEDIDLTGWDTYVTFEQKSVEITRTNAYVESVEGEDYACVVEVTLTQAETLRFKRGQAQAQIRAYKDGTAVATDYFSFDVGDILLNGEIPQEA